ncbi:MAG: SpoIIE family protein phosphatase [Planctomycetota bacterium]
MASADSSPPRARRPVDVVIAEDSKIQAKLLERRLTEAGHAVRWGADGGKALALVRERRPDIIISDIEMPEMTGYEFCKIVKTDPDLRTIPLILLSSLGDPVDIIRGLDAWADNYVTKPYEPEYLLGRMDSLLASPLAAADATAGNEMEVTVAGQTFKVNAGRQQVLNLLVSVFENAVTKNKELISTNQSLSVARDQLQKANTELVAVNEQIERSNRRMTRDLHAAAKVQQSLLPQAALDMPATASAWRYVPCNELAGDFLNIFALDDEHVGMFVVDVSGHGVPSSLLAVTVGAFLTPRVSDTSLLLRPSPDGGKPLVAAPAEVVTQLNNLFQADNQAGLYFTIVYGILHVPSGKLRFVSGGHPPLLHVPKTGALKLFEVESFPVGFVPDVEFAEETLQLAPGDRVILYSDGVPEAMDEKLEQMGNERMTALVESLRGESVDVNVVRLLESVQAWCQPKGPLDDVSILCLEWAGPAAG